MRQALGPGALGKPRGSGWRGRWAGGSGWGNKKKKEKRWIYSWWRYYCWATPPRLSSLVLVQPQDWRVWSQQQRHQWYIDKKSYMFEANGSWSDSPPWTADGGQDLVVTAFASREIGRLPVIGGTDIRLAHPLLGKPAERDSPLSPSS